MPSVPQQEEGLMNEYHIDYIKSNHKQAYKTVLFFFNKHLNPSEQRLSRKDFSDSELYRLPITATVADGIEFPSRDWALANTILVSFSCSVCVFGRPFSFLSTALLLVSLLIPCLPRGRTSRVRNVPVRIRQPIKIDLSPQNFTPKGHWFRKPFTCHSDGRSLTLCLFLLLLSKGCLMLYSKPAPESFRRLETCLSLKDTFVPIGRFSFSVYEGSFFLRWRNSCF